MDREVPTVRCRDLHKGRVHRGHGLAAILAVISLRGARHRIAALHRLFWRSHGVAIERVYPKQDCHDRDQDWIRNSHCFKANGLKGLRQGWLRSRARRHRLFVLAKPGLPTLLVAPENIHKKHVFRLQSILFYRVIRHSNTCAQCRNAPPSVQDTIRNAGRRVTFAGGSQ
jgi:hypothetical protein